MKPENKTKNIWVEKVSLSLVRESKTNPRKKFPAEGVKELAESMRESGLIQPLTVRPLDGGVYEIVAGATRYRAAKLLAWEQVDCVVRFLTDQEVAVIQMAENVARRSLNPMEEADGLARMVALGMDPMDCARKLGVSDLWVQGRLALCDLPKEAREAVEDERLSVESAKAILKVDPEDQAEAVQDLMQFGEEISTAQVLDRLRERYFAPRARRAMWGRYVPPPEFEGAEKVEYPEAWGEYVHPYGKAIGRWRVANEAIGAAAARVSDSGITWGQLAEALGIPGVLVPVGGVLDAAFLNVVMLVDGQVILAAEKAAKKAGEPFTIGKRVVESTGKQAKEDEGAEASGVLAEEFDPWAVSLAIEENSTELVAVFLAEVLTLNDPSWIDDAHSRLIDADLDFEEFVAEEFGTVAPVAVWWFLKGESGDGAEFLADQLGVREIWEKGGRA